MLRNDQGGNMKNLRETTRKIIYALLTVVMVVSLAIAGAIVAIDLVDLWRAGSVSNDVRELYRPGASDGWLAALTGRRVCRGSGARSEE